MPNINITEEFINSTAPNQNAILNGWGLVRKNSFVKYAIAADAAVIFGECKGSGASNYVPSVDFANPESPVFRCTCPSRQFPCKHALGLMYAYVSGKKFQVEELPADLAEKREKAEKKAEKKEKAPGEPKKANKSALLKKIKAQKEGLDLLEKITFAIVRSGLGTVNAKTLKMLEEQAKQLGNYYIPGAQTALREFIVLFQKAGDPEKIYTDAEDCLVRLYALCKKGREYLEKKENDPEGLPDTGLQMEEWLGRAWQLSELGELGLVQKEAELVQLSFCSYTDEARQEFVDAGIWMSLKTGQIVETRNYRPFKAAKYIREDDSFFSVAQVKELFFYPGEMNPRVRWESMTTRALEDKDLQVVLSQAFQSCQEAVRQVKNQIKNPLSSKCPAALVRFAKIGTVDGLCVLEDTAGQRLLLDDIPGGVEPPSVRLLALTERENLLEQALLVRFYQDMDSRRLYGKPLSIVTHSGIIRLI